MKKKKIDKTRALYIGVIVFLCAVFVVGFCYGLDTVLKMEGAYPPVVNEEGVTPSPESKEESVNMLLKASNSAVSLKPQAERSYSISFDEGSLTVSGSEEMKETLVYLRKNIENAIEDMAEEQSNDFGEELSAYYMPEITAEDVLSCESDYIYYLCPSCGEKSDTALSSCSLCGGVNPYNEVYADDYTVTMYLQPALSLTKSPRPVDFSAIEKLNGLCSGTVKIENFERKENDFILTYKVSRLKDTLGYVEYASQFCVKATLTFEGEYAELSECEITVNVTEKTKYNLTYPGLELNKHEMSIEPKSTDNLLATLICSDPTKYDVKWESGDESKATVDSEGYIKAKKETGFVMIKASFIFQGKTYTDSCRVFVGYSVESVSLSSRKLTLSEGDTVSLTYKVSPSDATNKIVTWHTRDESVAVVDQNGYVTATGKGSTQIYILSDDGYFRSTCEVTVK